MVFSTFGINFYEEIAGLKSAEVFALVFYTYGWSYGCSLAVQNVRGDVWALEGIRNLEEGLIHTLWVGRHRTTTCLFMGYILQLP